MPRKSTRSRKKNVTEKKKSISNISNISNKRKSVSRKGKERLKKSLSNKRKSVSKMRKKSHKKMRKTYKMNSPKDESKMEESFNFIDLYKNCTILDVELSEKQQFYNEHMDAASCVFKKWLFHYFQCVDEDDIRDNEDERERDIDIRDKERERGRGRERERDIDRERDRERERQRTLKKVDRMIRIINQIGYNLRLIYRNNLILFKETEGKYKGNLLFNIPVKEDVIRRTEDEMKGFFNVREYGNIYQTVLSKTNYPKIGEIFDNFFKKNELEVEEIIQSGYYSGDVFLKQKDLDKYYEKNYNGILQGTKLGKYQVLFLLNGTFSIKHPNYIKDYLSHPSGIQRKDNALYELSIKWCDIVDKHNQYKSGHLEQIDLDDVKKLCFEIYYLFINIVPYNRGSATAAKVLLNACLSAFGFDFVRETPEYNRHADWVAFVSDDFEDFYSKIDIIFMNKG